MAKSGLRIVRVHGPCDRRMRNYGRQQEAQQHQFAAGTWIDPLWNCALPWLLQIWLIAMCCHRLGVDILSNVHEKKDRTPRYVPRMYNT